MRRLRWGTGRAGRERERERGREVLGSRSRRREPRTWHEGVGDGCKGGWRGGRGDGDEDGGWIERVEWRGREGVHAFTFRFVSFRFFPFLSSCSVTFLSFSLLRPPSTSYPTYDYFRDLYPFFSFARERRERAGKN